MRLLLIISTILCYFGNAFAQSGCTDPQATNYDPSATQNDGSCLYPSTNYTLNQLAILPELLIENSGLFHTSNGLYTHNDAGNSNEIYRIDSLNGTVLQTLLVIGENEDWEDMAESETHVFIGDFGNNDGDRTDLRIYKIAKAELGNNILNAQPINFSFADQTDFSENNNNHNYDCESFFFHDDSLHLFTKNWVDKQTRHYAIPAEPGFYSALPKLTFNANGLITSADINEDGTVALLGYTTGGTNFMWLLFDYANNDFFSGNKRRIELGNVFDNSQTEAITFKDKDNGYISSERFNVGPVEIPPKLMSFRIDQWIPATVSATTAITSIEKVRCFPNPFNNQLTFDLSENWPNTETAIKVFDANGKLLLDVKTVPSHSEVKLESLEGLVPGIYLVQLLSGEHFWQGKVVKRDGSN